MKFTPFRVPRLVSCVSLALVAMAGIPSIAVATPSLTLDANIELDTDAVKASSSKSSYDQGGRLEVNFMAEHRMGDHFVRGKGTGLLKTDGKTATDDMWLMFGSDQWDIQAGRFEAVNLFPLGKDTVIMHAGDGSARVYEANLVRGRVSDGGQFAFHANPSDQIRFELATAYGQGDKSRAFTGVRPSVTFVGQGFTLTAGYEHQKFDDAQTTHKANGVGVTAGFTLGDAQVNLSAAHLRDRSQPSTVKVNSYGANLTLGGFGAGIIHSTTALSQAADPDVTTAYAAYTLPLFDIQNASVTFAGSTSRADNVASDKTVHALRLRFNYTF
ncbi:MULTISPECIES: carbohydrate porin [Nitrincola]|uniref:Porin n=1 Tax=Nitrincola nitratireducens TaxID=1229521 RepID=W9USC3_9GAMM|nr:MULTISPECIES: carbohydrate porin [Nitrincola]EXJ09984.1 hypothetical protein D791_03138 [Nitrincola nitratireducens]